MKITPLFDNILLKAKSNLQNENNLIIVEDENEKPDVGVVCAIGTGGKIDGENINFQVKVNNTVLYNKYATTKFVINNETYFLIKECDILAIID